MMMKSKTLLSIDIETYSETDLKSCGAYKYVDDPAFEIILFSYSWNLGEVKCVDLLSGEKIPDEVCKALFSKEVIKTAFNAAFERAALEKYFCRPCPAEQWECSMVLAAQMGLPLSLEKVSEVLLKPDKAKLRTGKALIRFFCVPCRATKINGGRTRNFPEHAPEKWDMFKEYNKQDVIAENAIRRKLQNHIPPKREHNFWALDQKINGRGIRVDLQLAEKAIQANHTIRKKATAEMKALTKLDNPSSLIQLKNWLKKEEGKEVTTLSKKILPELMRDVQSKKSLRVLQLHQILSKSSIKKYEAVIRCACHDAHIRGMFQFYGANRTGRFAGRLVQLQNIPQNHLPDIGEARSLVKTGELDSLEILYENIPQVLSELIRTCFIPEEGCKFIVSDFSAIEARVVAWYAKEDWVLQEFQGAGKIYEATASQMFGVPKELIVKGKPEYELRAKGKIATLALGYQGGTNALVSMGALSMGLSEAELPELVTLWRNANPGIVKWWMSMEKAAQDAIRRKGSGYDDLGGIEFNWSKGQLYMLLPSGRSLCYMRARIGTNRFGKPAIVYEGTNQLTKNWGEQETYGGKLVENCVQATARDCLRESMLRLDDAGYDIRIHVHDEVVINEPTNGRTVADVEKIMGLPIDWAPGLPLRADGYETLFYRKD